MLAGVMSAPVLVLCAWLIGKDLDILNSAVFGCTMTILICGLIGWMADMSRELRAARDASEAASAARNAFFAHMSHEIRTPMNGIMGTAELMLRDPTLPDSIRSDAETVHGSAEALLRLLNDLLDFSRLESQQVRFEEVPFDLASITLQVIKLVRGQARVPIHMDYDTDAPRWLSGDPYQLRQVLLNLVGNAAKFTDQGEIRVSIASGQQGRIRVAVTDTGEGISAERLEAIFEPFTQAERSTFRRRGGTGLGLPICQQIIEGLGGEIGVESTKGKGSVFWFELAMSVASPVVEAAPTHGTTTVAAGHILVVDDHPINRRIAGKLLADMGCTAAYATNGLEAVEAVKQTRFDAVLMDCQMPEMDGLQATEAIRFAETGERLPIIALTASVLPQDRLRCEEVGMDDFLSKPFRRDELLTALSRFLKAS